MNKILKYKKTAIISLILLATLIAGLCILSFGGRKITVDNNNPNFCYSLDKLPPDGDVSGISNAIKISTYTGDFDSSKVKFIATDGKGKDNEYEITETWLRGIGNVGLALNGESDFSRIDVYLIHNVVSDVPKEWVPKVGYLINDGVMQIDVDRVTVNTMRESKGNQYVVLYLLIVIS